ncbi:gephyrin-like molybdotransferase Glp [Pelagovum pacificum]|uniref:Molybdopterin molybdenumtransferase n=1 Tax=Pelagovum pacificum TaxID=2588711 RepID=A0A5C5GFX7_9RHOB|nr:gephyrin-like molybdotransferase Glp [Pelagovum pacificum]QQA43218.1 molybdopterin molybdenumtransferase MoeA [Pelagovum pacificum]TNY33642.1 molybdopterin molybdenumtransferase MoeA [Pelagovum pacificum]
MTRFDAVLMVDWSGSATPTSAKPKKDAIWIGEASDNGVTASYHRTRASAMAAISARIDTALAHGERLLIGFDFPFAYPRGFAHALTGATDPLGLWDWLAERIEDAPDNANNRFEVAAAINARFPGVGPFWGRPAHLDLPDLPTHGSARTFKGFPERREVEGLLKSTHPCWKLFTTGSVGSQALLGLPRLAALRQRYGKAIAISPFERAEAPVVLAEIFPTLLDRVVRARTGADDIRDEVQVRTLAEAFFRLAPEQLAAMLAEGDAEEGWILGIGHADALERALPSGGVVRDFTPVPPLSDDCFALPRGVTWTPVDEALDLLRDRLSPVTESEICPVTEAVGLPLAEDAVAARSHPPGANAAVDGYGFAHPGPQTGALVLPLVRGRAAAGAPFDQRVASGQAVRILTGALLPDGVDTVALQEDCAVSDGDVAMTKAPKPGANTRKAGEDIRTGDPVLPAGRVLTPGDLATLSAAGLGTVTVRRRLRVGVLSTGDELRAPGEADGVSHTIDANRPMLLSLLGRWGYEPVDLGIAPDSQDAVRDRLEHGAAEADAILTSGGASAGDEDHVSRLLNETGSMQLWRIAVKPGRPLALGLWRGAPIFGLPGNPVAAFVCTLIFARPALARLAGAGWPDVVGFEVPAAFTKSKKQGRREYLRARIREGRAEVFASEGSGRVTGLSWAEGLVELAEPARQIAPGDPVRFLPFGSFGL